MGKNSHLAIFFLNMNLAHDYVKQIEEMLILRGQNWLGKTQSDFRHRQLLQQVLGVDINILA